jgi:hypothetical protein
VLYKADLIELIKHGGLRPHLYADDTQVYGSCPPAAIGAFSAKVTDCVDAVASWMKSNRLQLNSDKTEILWCATGRRQHQLPTNALAVDGVPVPPVTSVRDLGIYIDADLVMRTHVQRTVSCCFAALRQLRQIRRCVSADTLRTLVVSLVLVAARLRQQRADRTPRLSHLPAPVSVKCVGPAYLRPAPL